MLGYRLSTVSRLCRASRAVSPSAWRHPSTSLPRRLRMFSGVVNLSDEPAVEKFRMLNHKSVLYFTATWCGPCRAIKPLYEELAKQYEGKITFGKVDVDENQEAALTYEIQAVPTFVLFDGESAVERFSGADAGRLQQLLKDLADR